MILVADFETTAKTQFELESKTRVYLFQIKSLDNKINHVGTSIQEFFQFIETLNDRMTIYFHNLSFDGEFLLWYLLEHGYRSTDLDEIEPKTFANITTDMGQHYMIKVGLPSGFVVDFKCSFRLMPISIEKIGKMVGVEKLKGTHNYTELKNYTDIWDVSQEELAYLENDVEILRLLIIRLKAMGIKQMTMSSSSYDGWKKTQWLFSKSLTKSNDAYVNQAIDRSYKGGITMLNPEYDSVELNDVISYDVNSLYPSQMLNNTMPVGDPIVFDTFEEATKDSSHKKFIMVVYVVDMKVLNGYHPFIGLSSGFLFSSYKYERTIQDKTLYLWKDEYDLFMDYYDGDYEVIRVLAFKERADVFTNYLDKWKTIKETTQDAVEKQIAKLMMNSLYGKFGQKDSRIKKKVVGADLLDGRILYDNIEEEAPYKFRPIASYITSMSRCVLIKAIQENAENFVYCDTDSLYLKDLKEAKNIPISSNIIGNWKFESHYTRFKCIKPKCYIKLTDDGKLVRSIAGLPKDAQDLVNFDNLKKGLVLNGVKKFMHKVYGGIIIDNTDFTINIDFTNEQED